MGRELANAHYIFNLSSVAILFYLSCLGSSNLAILLCTFSYSAYYIVYSFALHILLQYILFYTLLYSTFFYSAFYILIVVCILSYFVSYSTQCIFLLYLLFYSMDSFFSGLWSTLHIYFLCTIFYFVYYNLLSYLES